MIFLTSKHRITLDELTCRSNQLLDQSITKNKIA